MFNILKILDIRKQESVPYYKKIIVNKNECPQILDVTQDSNVAIITVFKNLKPIF